MGQKSGFIVRRAGGIFLILLSVIQTSWAQKSPTDVDFLISDEKTGAYLIGATVRSGNGATTTGISGEATLLLSVGDSVRVTYIGMKEVLHVIAGGEDLVRIEMEEENILLNTATVSSMRFEKPLAESAVSIEVLRPEFIERNASHSINDALDRTPGVQIIDNQANIRGGSGWSYGAGSRVMLVLDDMPLLQVDAATSNWTDLPMENIGAIEILKGASSVLYGSSALNGVIHFRTNYPKTTPETVLSIQGTQYDMPNDSVDYDPAYETTVSLIHRRKLNKVDLILGALYRKQASFRMGAALDYGRANVHVRYRPNNAWTFGVQALITPGTSSDYFFWDQYLSYRGDSSSITTTNRIRWNADPYVQWKNGAWTHTLQTRWYHIKNDNANNQSNRSENVFAEYKTKYHLPASGLTFNGGLLNSYTVSNSDLYSDTTFYNTNSAIYAQVEKKLGRRWWVTGGVRWERNALKYPKVLLGDTLSSDHTVEGQPVFRWGVNYQPAEATYLRMSWGQGYRFPSIAEKFIYTQVGGLSIRPNPELQSEYGWTAELGCRQGFKSGFGNGYLDLSIFRSEYDNMMEFGAVRPKDAGLPPFISRNVGAVRIDGVESNFYYLFKRGKWKMDAQIGLTYINPRFLDWDKNGIGAMVTDPTLSLAEINAANSTADHDVLKYRNRWNFKADMQWSYGNLFLGGYVNRVSGMEAIDRVLAFFIPGMIDGETIRLAHSARWVFDVRAGFSWHKFTFHFLVKNALDRRYWSRPGYLEAPRNYTCRMDVKL